MDCDIVLVGLNYRTAAVDVRERFALVHQTDPENWALPLGGAVHEALILSTCNRVELLAMGTGDVRSQMLAAWAKARQASVQDLEPYTYTYHNDDAVRHLFSVASSLDSMVLGEPQILGQLKQAYRKAAASHATGVILNHLLHKAFSVAKRVRTETAVASSAVSISYAAVELAKRIFGTMSEHRAMLIGAGEMAELAATHLVQNGIAEILVSNRTFSKAEELARFYHGRAVPFESLNTAFRDVDIVITSTGAPEAIIHAKDIRQVLRARRNRPMFFIDIAVPRDVDPDVNGLDNIYLYDIDDLKEVVEENRASRRGEAIKAEGIVEEEMVSFREWLARLNVQPTIKQLVQIGQDTICDEVDRTMRRLGSTDETLKEALECMGQALVKKFLHAPISYLKEGDSAEHSRHILTIQQVFNLDGHCQSRFAQSKHAESQEADNLQFPTFSCSCQTDEAAADGQADSAGRDAAHKASCSKESCSKDKPCKCCQGTQEGLCHA